LHRTVIEECPSVALGPKDETFSSTARNQNYPVLRGDLRAIFGEGAASSAMVGVGESYLPAFVLAMGMGQVAAGLVTTIPLVAGAALQLVAPWAVRRLGSHRRWVVGCALLQAISFVPLCVAALWGTMHVVTLFAVTALYWGAGLGTASAWSTWVDTLVPARIRARYFARRTRYGQFATLIGFVIAGWTLQLADWADMRLVAFAGLFLMAGVCRCASVALLSRQSEPQPLSSGQQHVSMAEFFGRFRTARDGRLLVYLLSVQTAAQIAGPYFTSYMLGPMQLTYASYVTLIAISFAAKAIALPALGRFAQCFGTHQLLWLGGLGIVPISGLWVISNAFPFLVFVQILAGVTWAAYELAMCLLFFEAIRPEERTSILTTFNFANAVATATGSLLGAALLALFGKHQQTYLVLFALSASARALTLLALARVSTPSFARFPAFMSNRAIETNPPRILSILPKVSGNISLVSDALNDASLSDQAAGQVKKAA